MENFIFSLTTIFFTLIGSLFGNISKFSKPEIITPCSPPIRYQLGTIDKKFKLQEKTVLNGLKQAEKIWEEPFGKNLFVYDPGGKISLSKKLVTLNFVYDERQQLNTKIKQLEGSVQSENKKMQTSISEYEARVKALNQQSGELSERMKNLDIKDPEYSQKFDAISKEGQALNQEAQSLNEMAATLNQSTQSYNKEVVRLNNTIYKFNKTMTEKPEEGVYKSEGEIIEIYLTNSNNELIHTLAHELGHTLGVNHLSNTKAIMYSSTSETIKLADDDLAALQEVCKEQVVSN